jgi:hypothetical protein
MNLNGKQIQVIQHSAGCQDFNESRGIYVGSIYTVVKMNRHYEYEVTGSFGKLCPLLMEEFIVLDGVEKEYEDML